MLIKKRRRRSTSDNYYEELDDKGHIDYGFDDKPYYRYTEVRVNECTACTPDCYGQEFSTIISDWKECHSRCHQNVDPFGKNALTIRR